MIILERTGLKILNVPKYTLNKENTLQNKRKIILTQSTYY